MYNYSPIAKFRIKNFRNIGDVELDFSDSPIVTLVGKNESGKTSIVKAFETCALHASPREQKDWIRDNTNMFGVQIDLQDGTQIIRIKEDGGINLYRVIYPDGHQWDVSKLTEGLPSEVSRVMGLIEEPETKEYLHVRTYEDKLLFIVTPSSTNYKVMYNALKVEQLTKAIKHGSNEMNELKSEIDKNQSSIQTLTNQMKSINVVDLTSLISMRERMKQQLTALGKIKKAVSLASQIETYRNQLGAISIIDRFGLGEIDEVLAARLVSVSNVLENKEVLENKRNAIKDATSMEGLDTRVCERLWNIIEKNNELSEKIAQAGPFSELSSLTDIDEVLTINLMKISDIVNKLGLVEKQAEALKEADSLEYIEESTITKLEDVINRISAIENAKNQYEEIVAYIEQVNDYLIKVGVAVESCPKCGEAVIFDMDKLNTLGAMA